ncbi:MAG TPA: aminoglycoside phosphotransferase family protein [Acidimicrobiia bacterium]
MLAPPDAAIAARDPTVPGLGTVLDPEAVAHLLGGLFATPLRVVPSYVRYKPGSSCLVGFRVEGAGEESAVYAKAFGRGQEAKLAKLASSPQTAAFEGELVGLSVFPNDRLMPVLGRLSDPKFIEGLLARIWPEGSGLGPSHLEMLRWKPERRYVARVDAHDHPVGVLKAYCPDDYLRSAKVAKVSADSNGLFRTPERFGASDRHRVVLREWLPGQPLGPTAPTDEMEAVGAVMAGLHRRSKKHLRRRRRREIAAEVRAAGEYLGLLLPEIASEAGTRAARLARRIRQMEKRKVPIHGDFSVDQLVLGAFGVGVLDLDNAALGDPAADAGWFIADLELGVLQGTVSSDEVEKARSALIAGYRAAGGEDLGDRLSLYVSASLLQRAPEPFRHRWDNWPESIAALIRRAGEVSPL